MRKLQQASASRDHSTPSGSSRSRARDIGGKRAHIAQPEQVLQPVTISQRLAEQFSGIEKQDRGIGINFGHQMQQHGGLRAEGRHHCGFTCELALERELQDAMRVERLGPRLKQRQDGLRRRVPPHPARCDQRRAASGPARSP